MPYTDDQLRQAVDAVFNQFDADKSGFLDSNEVMALINTALQHMKANRQASQKEVNDLVTAVDKNGDGKIAKPELFEIFKRVANQ
jgi:Ca2+-binding EF-hand superfamily protein